MREDVKISSQKHKFRLEIQKICCIQILEQTKDVDTGIAGKELCQSGVPLLAG
jgi:hypothetical protein